MDSSDERIWEAIRNTEILRAPRQNLYTFGTTNITYYLVTQPAYSDAEEEPVETVVREGKVVAERPKIVTPFYMSHLDGFGEEARRYFDFLAAEYGANSPGVLYTYKNEPKDTNIVSEKMRTVVEKINAQIDERGDKLAAIIRGQDVLWDVSVLKFIFELTRRSLGGNVSQFERRGLLNVDSSGVPGDARMRIEESFRKVARGEMEPRDLKDELDRWQLFHEYEDRFLTVFKNRRGT